MANRNSNFPSNQLNALPPEVCKTTVDNLMQLSNKGKPKTEIELQERINQYFEFCAERGFRPGIETMCLALSCTRQCFWKWCNGEGKSQEWAEICSSAKQFTVAFLEQLSLTGKINPANSIFYLKNWANYADSVTIEPVSQVREVLPMNCLPWLGSGDDPRDTRETLPELKVLKD